jgi:hypothetical protein
MLNYILFPFLLHTHTHNYKDNIDALILFTYNDGYSGLRGNVAYVNNKLVIGGRVSLWDEVVSTFAHPHVLD